MKLSEVWSNIPWIPDRRPIYEWAAENLTMPPTLTFDGKFDPTISRQFLAPLDALKNDRVREVNILAPPRSGKTLIADLFVPHTMARDPGPVLWVFAVDEQAKRHCESRLMPMVKGCPQIASLLSEDRHKTRSTEIQLANGYPLRVVGNSERNLQAQGYRYLVCDEVWEWPRGVLAEAKPRVNDFRRTQSSKVLIISQGGDIGGEWFAQYTGGRIHEWEVPCDKCGVYEPPVFSGKHEDGRKYGMVWDCEKHPDGTYNFTQAKETTRYVCKHCGHEHTECAPTQQRWNNLGRYREIEGGDAEVHSYHWTDEITSPWSDIVTDFLKARWQSKRGNHDPIVAFMRKRRAEFASEGSVLQQERQDAVVEMGPQGDWPEEAIRVASIDVQEGYFWLMIRAWAKSAESRRIFWGKCQDVAEVERMLELHKVKGNLVVIDAANRPQAVYDIAAPRGWICVIGSHQRGWYHRLEERGQLVKHVEKAWSPRRWGQSSIYKDGKRLSAMCFLISKPSTADRLQGLRDRALWTEPKVELTKEERDYASQMASMVKVRKGPGEPEEWTMTGVEPHAWDCARMNTFVAMAKGIA